MYVLRAAQVLGTGERALAGTKTTPGKSQGSSLSLRKIHKEQQWPRQKILTSTRAMTLRSVPTCGAALLLVMGWLLGLRRNVREVSEN